MGSLAYIAPWVFASVCVGLAVGFFVGRGRSSNVQDDTLMRSERQVTLKVLLELLKSAEQISSDVECHNSEIRETAEHMGNIQATGEMELVKQAVLGQITALTASNKRLQHDLSYSCCRMEELAQEIDVARREARTDPLTSVSNRKACDEKLLLSQATWEREGHPYVLILVDLDQFKRINDSHGHQAGDRVLQKVGTWLREWVREGDFVGRYGGDEFIVLLPYTDLDVGMELAEMLRSRTADETSRIAVRGEQVSVSLSIGVAAPREGDTLETVLDRADQALYKSKRLGRNQVNCQQPDREELLAKAHSAASGS